MSSYNARPSLVRVARTNTTDPARVPEHMRTTGCSYGMMIIHGFKLELLFCYLFTFFKINILLLDHPSSSGAVLGVTLTLRLLFITSQGEGLS